MEKFITMLIILCSLAFTGCAMTHGPVRGGHLTLATGPVSSSGQVESSKIGEAGCVSILGMFGFGDCTIKTAAANGGISQISSVEAKTVSVLGLFASYTTVVRGN